MRIISIEPTPNPNSMKLNMDESLPVGLKLDYTNKNVQDAPPYIQSLLQIPGVRSVYQVADFIALERHPKADWQDVLSKVQDVLEQADGDISFSAWQTTNAEGETRVHVFVQIFREIPLQVKLLTPTEDIRVALPDRFKLASKQAAMYTEHFLTERKWEDRGFHVGDPTEIGNQFRDEIAQAYDEKRLQELVDAALQLDDPNKENAGELESLQRQLRADDWKARYTALEQLEPTEGTIPLLETALQDSKPTVRRLATVYLGTLGEVALPYLYEALRDPSASVRRAAGDCLSDIGSPQAIPQMAEALQDPSKLVRWRAARFLYEVGDASALPALRAAEEDPEFEVQMQVQMAIERIEGGQEAQGPVWQQITKRLSKEP